jgi:hypothetical protein
MESIDALNDRVGRLAARLRGLQRERDQRTQLAIEMLVKIEERVRSQRAALDEATHRIVALEKERDAAVQRASEIVDLYESSLSNNDAFFKGIETLASRIVKEAGEPAKPVAPQPPTAPPPKPPPSQAAALPRPPEKTTLVQGPSKTPFLGERGPERLQRRSHAAPDAADIPSSPKVEA